MIIGIRALKTLLASITPSDEIPTPALAVPYEAPRLANTNADATPMYPKKYGEASGYRRTIKVSIVHNRKKLNGRMVDK